MQEIWKDIIIDNKNTGWKVSNLGQIQRKDGSFTFGGKDSNGYKSVQIYNKKYRVHRLVALAFIPNPENKPCIDHINTIKTDNTVENLRWCTHKENSNNPLTVEAYLKRPKHYGYKNGLGNKSTSKKVKCVETGEIFENTKQALKKYNIKNKMAISNAANPKSNQKTAGGYHWEYLS